MKSRRIPTSWNKLDVLLNILLLQQLELRCLEPHRGTGKHLVCHGCANFLSTTTMVNMLPSLWCRPSPKSMNENLKWCETTIHDRRARNNVHDLSMWSNIQTMGKMMLPLLDVTWWLKSFAGNLLLMVSPCKCHVEIWGCD